MSRQLSSSVLFIGEGKEAERTAAALERAGRLPRRADAAGLADLAGGTDIVVAGSPSSSEYYERIAALRQAVRAGARVYSMAQVFGDDSRPDVSGGEIPGPLRQVAERFPLRGSRTIAFGRPNGAIPDSVVALGVGALSCVAPDLREVLRVLVARHYLGWDNVDVIFDDMHLVDSEVYGRYHLVVCHDIYERSLVPFRYIRNLTTLSDTIYLGGFCANPSRLKAPLAELEHGGEKYRVQPFRTTAATSTPACTPRATTVSATP